MDPTFKKKDNFPENILETETEATSKYDLQNFAFS